jgi:hypothetical protein
MNRFAVVLIVMVVATFPAYGQSQKEIQKNKTWYEQALRHLNPNDIDYGSTWEQRKRTILDQVGNRYFQYSFVATVGIVVLFVLLCVQRMSHKRALDIAALSIADVLRHDEYSRQVADEAIRRYNEHIEGCNRLIEAGQDSEAELQRVRKELADTKAENKSLRNQLAGAQKGPTPGKAQQKVEQPPPVKPVKEEKESAPGHLVAQIQSLQKALREEQRKNQQVRGTSVDDHRA